MADVHLLLSPPPKLEEVQTTLFSADALEFIAKLHRRFDAEIEQLYKDRLRRVVEIQTPGYKLDFRKSPERIDKSWTIAPLPSRLQNRQLDLGDVSASNKAHFVAALNADVQGIQVDFDDGHCPTWRNQLLAHYNVMLAVRGSLPGAPLVTACPVLMLRPRAWNMLDHHVLIDGKEAIGPLIDFGLIMHHNAQLLYEAHSGPFFYLSKLEGASEARLWNDIFIWSQNQLGLPQGTIKACVLIENIISTFEMEEILFALREHSLGLNCGIWDYCASIITKFGDRQEFLLPDRNKYVNMDRKFLASYLQLAVATCHGRRAPATGGMAALTLPPGASLDDVQCKTVINRILAAKLKEIQAGVDGFMVYDTRVVPYVNELWKRNCPTPNQIHQKVDVVIHAGDLLAIPSGGVTMEGVNHNTAITILFIYHWLAGVGHFFYNGAVEDSATAEISRAQIWQWIRFASPLEDAPDTRVSAALVEKTAADFTAHAHKHLCRSTAERKRLSAARYMSFELFMLRHQPTFLTSYLNDNHKFRTLHNKSLLSHL